MTISETFPSEAYSAGRTVIARYDEHGRREYEVEERELPLRLPIVSDSIEAPERRPIAGFRPTRPRTVADRIQVPQTATQCPRCNDLLWENAGVIICSRESACGWRSSYPLGTERRADGSSIFDAA